MSVQQFKKLVEKDRKQLVIIDDMVIDISSFMFDHPGGRFVLQHLIGADVSKYFYGAYTYENYISDKTTHTHSQLARRKVGNLAIARLDNSEIVKGEF